MELESIIHVIQFCGYYSVLLLLIILHYSSGWMDSEVPWKCWFLLNVQKRLSLTLSTGCVCSTRMFAFTAMTKVVTSVFWCHNCHSNNTQCFPVLLFVSKFLNEYALFLPFSLWQNILFHKYCDRNLPTTVLGKEISINGRKKKEFNLNCLYFWGHEGQGKKEWDRSWRRRPTTHDPFLSSSNLKWILQQKRDVSGKTGKNPNNVCT